MHTNTQGFPAQWLMPISKEAPCGPCMEYDPRYMHLMHMVRPAEEVQYGDFVSTSAPPDWHDIRQQCRTLMASTHDIALTLLYVRSMTQQAGAAGLHHGLSLLLQQLSLFAAHIHPLPLIGNEPAPELRANVLASLASQDGLRGDLCQTWHAHHQPAADDIPHLHAAHALVMQLQQWCRHHLKDHAPDLSPLADYLQHVLPVATSHVEEKPPVQSQGIPIMQDHMNRDTVITSLRTMRRWFEHNEPSSPVVLLLGKAEQLVGKRFSEVAHSIPHELLRQWESEIN